MYVSTKDQGVADWGKKLGSSWDPVYSIPILSQLQIILQFCETGCSILFLKKKPQRKSIQGKFF